MRRVVLASASAVRKRMLSAAGVSFKVIPSGIDESAMIAESLKLNESWEQVAISVAVAKAEAVSHQVPEAVVIGSDQLLVIDDNLLRKATTLGEAAERLKSMAGQTHQLISGVALAENGCSVWSHAEIVSIHMRSASEEAIKAYCSRRGEALLASVSCYEIEGEGAQLIEAIEGDVFSALGLPLLPTLKGLRQLKALRA